MVDYALWAEVDPLTFTEAAYLWAGLDPDKAHTYLQEQTRELKPRRRMIEGAINRGVLPAIHDGRYWRIARSALRAFAESKGERPRFLFYSELLAEQRQAAAAAATAPRRRITKAPPPVPTVRGGGPSIVFAPAKAAMPPAPTVKAEAAELAAPEPRRAPRLPPRQAAFLRWLDDGEGRATVTTRKELARRYHKATHTEISVKSINRVMVAIRDR